MYHTYHIHSCCHVKIIFLFYSLNDYVYPHGIHFLYILLLFLLNSLFLMGLKSRLLDYNTWQLYEVQR